MRVLLTNNTLDYRAGTELYVRDLAVELLRRGHNPVAYSTVLGEVAGELRGVGVPVINSLESLGQPPDIIHGHHHFETLSAMLAFPQTPAISYCHGWTPWEESPLRFPRILRYVAVDLVSRERLIVEGAIPPEKIQLIPNFFDPSRFPPRDSLPPRPRTALAFGNTFSDTAGLPVLREACLRHGIELHTAGISTGNPTDNPGQLLARYDLVFAIARCAIEALAVGASVVLCSADRLGPLVTPQNFAEVRPNNFGLRCTLQPLTTDALSAEIYKYNVDDAAAVSRFMREHGELQAAAAQIIQVYEEVLAEARRSPVNPSAACDIAVSRYFEDSASRFKATEGGLVHLWSLKCTAAEKQAAELSTEVEELRQDRSHWVARALEAGRSLAKIRLARRRAAASLPPMPFIVGAPRSGTTLLRFMLDAHPLLAIPPETGFLMQAGDIPTEGDAARHALFNLITNYPPEGPTWNDFGITREELLTALESVEPFDIDEGFRAFYRLYAARQKKPRYGDKTPLYCQHLASIRRILPEARFIHIIRDGRDAALSLRPQWFAPGKDMTILAAQWTHLVRTARNAGSLLPGRYLEVRYENLLQDTESVLRQICSFIQLPFDPVMLQYFERAPDRLKEHVARHNHEGGIIVTHEQRLQQNTLTMQPPRPDRIDRWKSEMTPAELAEFLIPAGGLLHELGYQVAQQ